MHGASATAREKVEAAGGTLTLLKEPKVKKAKKHAAPRRAAEADEADAEPRPPSAERRSEAEPTAEAEPESEE